MRHLAKNVKFFRRILKMLQANYTPKIISNFKSETMFTLY